jgi:hypothetical protein
LRFPSPPFRTGAVRAGACVGTARRRASFPAPFPRSCTLAATRLLRGRPSGGSSRLQPQPEGTQKAPAASRRRVAKPATSVSRTVNPVNARIWAFEEACPASRKRSASSET